MPVKLEFAPLKVNVEELFSVTLVTLEPRPPLMFVAPPVPMLVIEALLMLVPERVKVVELLFVMARLPVPLVGLETVNAAAPESSVRAKPLLPTVMVPVEIVNADVALLSSIPVTFDPTPPLRVVKPVPGPLLTIVPPLLTAAVEIVVLAVSLPLAPLVIVKLPDPEMPPENVVVPVPVEEMFRGLPLSPIAPLKVGAVEPPLLPMVSVPAALVARLIGFETVNELARRLALPPVELPRVIAEVEGPAAPLTVVALLTLAITVPWLINRPPAQVFAPPKVNEDVLLFSVTP